MANPFSYYQDLVEAIVAVDGLRVLPACDVAAGVETDQPVVTLRHDIDADIWTAIRAARLLARYGLCGSFYLLPTAGYYGQFSDGIFYRHRHVAGFLDALIQAGCEIGLHNDVFQYSVNYQVDGIQALQMELEWLRSQGAVVRGTAAHNSFPVFGAESFEVFEEWCLWNRGPEDKGYGLPLAVMSAAKLGLTYEANFPKPRVARDALAIHAFEKDVASVDIRNSEWMRIYLETNPCFQFGWDAQCWLVGRDWWVISCRKNGYETFQRYARRNDVVQFVRHLPAGATCSMVIHPCYLLADLM